MRNAIVLVCCVASALAAPGNSRIIGGHDAAQGQFPYQISIRYNGEHFCGGTILDENTILTAAHCLHEISASELTVAVGNNNRDEQTEEYAVSEPKPHEKYNRRTTEHDIAIIKLQEPIKLRDGAVEAVKLRQSDIDEEVVTLSGWGSIEHPVENIPNHLQFVDLKTIPNDKCRSLQQLTIFDTNVCTFTKIGEGTCHRDSGGPLVDQNKEQVGVVSWGTPCGVGYPDVYTRVYSYLEWIQANR